MPLARVAFAPLNAWRQQQIAWSGSRPSHRARSVDATCPFFQPCHTSRSRPVRRSRTSKACCLRVPASRSLSLLIRVSLRVLHPKAQRCIRSRIPTRVSTRHSHWKPSRRNWTRRQPSRRRGPCKHMRPQTNSSTLRTYVARWQHLRLRIRLS
jgi:hypothetical protein